MFRHLRTKINPAPSSTTTIFTTSSQDGYIDDSSGVKTVVTTGDNVITSMDSSTATTSKQGFGFFDTSSIPDAATILSAVLSFNVNSYTFFGGNEYVEIWTCASGACMGTTLDDSDWDIGNIFVASFSDFSNGVKLVTFPVSRVNVTGYTNVRFKAIALDNGVSISMDSVTKSGGIPMKLTVTYQ